MILIVLWDGRPARPVYFMLWDGRPARPVYFMLWDGRPARPVYFPGRRDTPQDSGQAGHPTRFRAGGTPTPQESSSNCATFQSKKIGWQTASLESGES